MAKKTIAIDIDDVTADSTESLRLLVNERVGANLTKEHYRVPSSNHGGYYEHVWETNGLSDKVNFAAYNAEMETDQMHVPLMQGAREAIDTLKKDFRVVFITARHPSWERATRHWFKEKFGDDIELHLAEGYNNGQTKTKGQLCKELGAEWLIDDVPSNCKTAIDEGIKTILFGEYGWHVDIPEGVIRCKTWVGALKVLRDVR
jgi:5'(3')-deoxyribonucleotidase